MAEKEKTEVAKANPADLAVNNAFIDSLVKQLTKKQEFGLSFPRDYSVSNALNSAYLILQETVDKDKKHVLLSCTKQSIASCLMDMAVQALNPMKKQCYFVSYGGKLTLMRSYQGTMAVAKRCGARSIRAEVIYENDKFTYHIQDGLKIIDEHTQDFMNIDTTKIKGAYAVVVMDDYIHVEVMNIMQIKSAWKKGFGYKENGGVHGEFTDQMAKKTVINRACKNIINSSDDAYLNEAFENTSENENIDGALEDSKHDITKNANSEEFVIDAEIVENKQSDIENPGFE